MDNKTLFQNFPGQLWGNRFLWISVNTIFWNLVSYCILMHFQHLYAVSEYDCLFHK